MSAAPQVAAIARRAVVRTARQPASAIPPLIFPVALMSVNAAGLRSSTHLPGFPTDSFLSFALASHTYLLSRPPHEEHEKLGVTR